MKSRSLLPILICIVGAAVAPFILAADLARAESPASFRIQQQWNLGGSAGWGALRFDPASSVLYVPRTGNVMVLDTATGKVTGEISGFVDAREVALDDQGRFGYVTDITDGTVGLVRVFDRSTLKLVSAVAVGRIPSAIVFDPVTKNLFAFSSRDRNVSVIDTKTNIVIDTISLPGKPHIAVTDGHGAIFAGFRGIGQMTRIDTATRKIAAAWSIAPCAELTGLAIDSADRQLLGSCTDSTLISVNADSGQVAPIGKTGIGAGDLAFDAQNHLLLSGASSGVLTIYHQDSPLQYTRREDVPTLPRAGTLAVDPAHDRAFLITAKFEQRPVVGNGMEESAARLTPVPDSVVVLVVGP